MCRRQISLPFLTSLRLHSFFIRNYSSNFSQSCFLQKKCAVENVNVCPILSYVTHQWEHVQCLNMQSLQFSTFVVYFVSIHWSLLFFPYMTPYVTSSWRHRDLIFWQKNDDFFLNGRAYHEKPPGWIKSPNLFFVRSKNDEEEKV